jgi:hypothetical protein
VAMQTHAALYLHNFERAPGPQHYPAKIEGVPTDILANYVAIPYADFSVHALLRKFGFEPFPATPLLFALAVPFALWSWLSRALPAERLLPAVAAWFFLTDLFLPAYRDNYNDVVILDVVLLGIITTRPFPWAAWPCAIALPLGWAVYAFSPEQAWIINVPTALFTVGAVLFLFMPMPRQTSGAK